MERGARQRWCSEGEEERAPAVRKVGGEVRRHENSGGTYMAKH